MVEARSRAAAYGVLGSPVLPMTRGVGALTGWRWATGSVAPVHPGQPIRLLATASAPPSGSRAWSDRARAAVALASRWVAVSLQVMVHSGPTSELPLRSDSKPTATERSWAPWPAAAEARAAR